MAQLDQLINAMIKHGAEALVLLNNQKPTLVMEGTERPIVKTPLGAGQINQLVAQIAPGDQLAEGQAGNFRYELAGALFDVQL